MQYTLECICALLPLRVLRSLCHIYIFLLWSRMVDKCQQKQKKRYFVKIRNFLCRASPILALMFVFVRQIDKDKHTATHKQGLRRRRRTWSSPCAHSYVDFSPAAKQGGELHPCQSLQAVGRWSVRWDNEHLALPPPATLRHTSAHSGTLQHCGTLTLTHWRTSAYLSGTSQHMCTRQLPRSRTLTTPGPLEVELFLSKHFALFTFLWSVKIF